MKQFFSKKSIQFAEIDTSIDSNWSQLLFLLADGRTSLPQVFINGKHVGGLDNIKRYIPVTPIIVTVIVVIIIVIIIVVIIVVIDYYCIVLTLMVN